MLRNALQNGRLVLFAGCAAVIIAGVCALRADLMVSHGFGKAFDAQKAPVPFEVVAPSGLQQHAHSGDEGYWLTRSEVESPGPFAKRLAIGDRITISGSDGRERNLEIVDIKSIGEPLTKVVAGSTTMRLLLVTCRIVGERDDKTPVRFIIEGEAVDPPALPPSAPKAL